MTPMRSHFIIGHIPIGRPAHLRQVGCTIRNYPGGGDVPMSEPKRWFKFKDIDKSIQELRKMFKVHPEWFETPKSKLDKGKNVVEYSIKS